MPLDTFICGSCLLSFNDIDNFIVHKRGCVQPPAQGLQDGGGVLVAGVQEDGRGVLVAGAQQDGGVLVAGTQLPEAVTETEALTAANTIANIEYSDKALSTTEGVIVNDSTTSAVLSGVLSEEALLGDNHQTVIILQGDLPNLNLGDATEQLLSGLKFGEISNQTATQTEPPKSGKKRGRPRKADQKVEKPKYDPEEKNEPQIGADGKLNCTRCKRSFNKERVFNAHKCLAVSDYIDLSNTKDLVKENRENLDRDETEQLQEEIQDDGEMDLDTKDTDYKAPLDLNLDDGDDDDELVINTGKADQGTGNGRGAEAMETGSIIVVGGPDGDQDLVGKGVGVEDGEGLEEKLEEIAKKAGDLGPVEVQADPDVDSSTIQKPTDSIEDVPVFLSEQDKILFEQSLNIDLTGVDSMFRTHCIYQDLNENAKSTSRMLTNELLLYSCNTCDKVFKTVSHMRLHVLIHTDLKPFRCHKCEYATNCRGNLYSHMRKHTGQFYRCGKCQFKTVNKSHLLEHEMTHDGIRHMCEICKKDYNTQKSLMNHVRKYHPSKKGREYLAKFMQTRDAKGSTVIHQCHVCNRKFKKKMDRDRHLFVHDIKDIPNIQKCMLCDYTASRKMYLEKHFMKHRCIYRCFSCDEKFLSSLKLIDHLTSSHMDSGQTGLTWEKMFEESINLSLYLPEPDSDIRNVEAGTINLPPELSASAAALKKQAEQQSNQEQLNEINSADKFINKDQQVLEIETQDRELEIDTEKDSGEGDRVAVIKMEEIQPSADDSGRDKDTRGTIAGDTGDPTEKDDNVIVKTMSVDTTAVDKQDSVGNAIDSNDKDDVINDPDSCGNTIDSTKKGDQNSSGSTEEGAEKDGNVTNVMDGPNSVVNASELPENNNSVKVGQNPVNNTGDTAMSVVETGEAEDKEIMKESYNEEVEENMETGAIETNEVAEAVQDIENFENEEEVFQSTEKIEELIERLGFLPMTVGIFQKMRETFGNEECEFCGRLFFSKVDYEPHVRTHTGDKPQICRQCGYQAITQFNLKRHIERDHEKIVFSCKECDFQHSSRTVLWNHQMKHTGLMGLECHVCGQPIASLKELRSHVLWKHPNADRTELDKLTGNIHRVQGKMGRRSFKCPYCSKVYFRASSDLQRHMWIHQGIKPFKCPLCNYSCRSKNNLQAHMIRHSKEKPFACPECGKAYKSMTALRWHIRSHGGKLFKCSRCPYEATQQSHLKRHLETHNVVKRYKCTECDYSANTLGYLKIHYTRLHKGVEMPKNSQAIPAMMVELPSPEVQDRNVYKCLSCDYLFGNLSDLKRHLKLRHHVEVKNLNSMEVVPSEDVQVMYEDPPAATEPSDNQVAMETTESVPVSLDEKTASAVNILQHIIDMSNQGAFSQAQKDGTPPILTVDQNNILTLPPETVIVHQDGEELVVANGDGSLDNQQFVIQYVTQQEGQLEEMSMVEVQTDSGENVVLEGLQPDGQTELHTEMHTVEAS